jgi:hypothetical protein
VIKWRIMRWVESCSTNAEGERYTEGLVEQCGGKKKRERPRRRWEDNTKMNLQDIGWGAMAGLAWLRIGKNHGLLYTR